MAVWLIHYRWYQKKFRRQNQILGHEIVMASRASYVARAILAIWIVWRPTCQTGPDGWTFAHGVEASVKGDRWAHCDHPEALSAKW
jgi:hypothetical protein